MKKPFKVLTSTSLAAALAASVLVPVASADVKNEVPTLIEDAVFNYGEDQNLAISFEDYREAFGVGMLTPEGFQYIKADNGKYYSFEDYRDAFGAKENVEEALALLEPVKVDNIVEGTVDKESKKVVAKDEQPEDRLNETFFYNVA